jgi:beta-galactosidase
VQAGGLLVCGFFSGIVDEHDHIRAPELHRLAGVHVDEFWPIPDGEEVAVTFAGGEQAVARDWSEWLELDGGEPIAHYASGVLAGRPAVVRNSIERGVAYYCSAGLDADGLRTLARAAWEDAGVRPLADAPAGVEICRRGPFLFLLNHTDEPVEVTLGPTRLEPLGVAIVREPG